MHNIHRGSIAITLSALLWALQAIISRLIGADFSPFYLVFIRSVILATFFSGGYLLLRNWKRVRKNDFRWFGSMSIPNAIAFASLFIAINHLPISTVLFIFYAIQVIGGYTLGSLLFQERLTSTKVFSLCLSLAGLGLIFTVSLSAVDFPYALLAMIAGFADIAWNILSKKLSSNYPLSEILFIDSSLLIPISFSIFLLSKEVFIPFSISSQWLWVMILAPVTIGAELTSVYGFRYIQAQIGSIIKLLEVIFGTILAVILFKEAPTTFSLLGGTFILLAAVLPNISFKQKSLSSK